MSKNQLPIRVWIQGSVWRGNIVTMLLNRKDMRFRQAESLAESDIVLYTGGADVTPELYGENKLQVTSNDEDRDRRDQKAFNEAKSKEIMQVGICRGSQFLNVMNGGTLWQDVNNHTMPHWVKDELSGKRFMASSTHHQASRLSPKGRLLAFTEQSSRKTSAKGGWVDSSGMPSPDVEAFWYPETKSLGVQWHPEIGPQPCVDVFFEYLRIYHPFKPEDTVSLEKAA